MIQDKKVVLELLAADGFELWRKLTDKVFEYRKGYEVLVYDSRIDRIINTYSMKKDG